jgi:hypothetical protein
MSDQPKQTPPQTVAGFARDIGMTRQALYKHIAAGRLKARKVGHFTVIDVADMDAFRARLRTITYGGKERSVVA